MSITWRRVTLIVIVAALTIAIAGGEKQAQWIQINGLYAKAFAAAYADFLLIDDLPASKKNLERYTVRFKRDGTRIHVVFVPGFPPGWLGSGETPYGREVMYVIDKKTNRIAKRQFGQ